jgi:hypothetical protein
VRKTVGGRPAVQLERLYHQIAWELDPTFLEVPRTGPRGRFFPIKEPEDMARASRGYARCCCFRAGLSSPDVLVDAADLARSKRALAWPGPAAAGTNRHEVDAIPSLVRPHRRDGPARAVAPVPVRSVRPGTAALRRVRRRADEDRAAGLRALRLPGRLAGAPLCRVLGQKAGVRTGPWCARLRRPGAAAGVGLEGAREAGSRATARRDRGRGDRAPGRRRYHVRTGGS